MVLDIIGNLFSSLVALGWGSLLYAIPVFLVALFIGRPLHAFFAKRFKRSWIQSAFAASFVVFFVILTFAFLFPVWKANQVSQIGPLPPELALSTAELAAQFVLGLVRVFLVSLLMALLSLPMVFVGAFVFESVSNHVKSSLVSWFIASFVCVLIVSVVVLFLAPWIVPGLIYLLYWA